VDAVRVDVCAYLARDRVDDAFCPCPQAVHRERRVEVEAQTLVNVSAAEAREVQRGLAQRLRRHPCVDCARAARARAAIDDGDALAEIRGLRRALLAGGPGADDHEVELFGQTPPVCPTGRGADQLGGARLRGRPENLNEIPNGAARSTMV